MGIRLNRFRKNRVKKYTTYGKSGDMFHNLKNRPNIFSGNCAKKGIIKSILHFIKQK